MPSVSIAPIVAAYRTRSVFAGASRRHDSRASGTFRARNALDRHRDAGHNPAAKEHRAGGELHEEVGARVVGEQGDASSRHTLAPESALYRTNAIV